MEELWQDLCHGLHDTDVHVPLPCMYHAESDLSRVRIHDGLRKLRSDVKNSLVGVRDPEGMEGVGDGIGVLEDSASASSASLMETEEETDCLDVKVGYVGQNK